MKTYWYFFYEALALQGDYRVSCSHGYVASDTEFFPLHRALGIATHRSRGGGKYHVIINQVEISKDDFDECCQKWRQ